jgi:hypothetical protein
MPVLKINMGHLLITYILYVFISLGELGAKTWLLTQRPKIFKLGII